MKLPKHSKLKLRASRRREQEEAARQADKKGQENHRRQNLPARWTKEEEGPCA